MKIAIMGAGAMGSLIGALLFEHGEDVILIDPWEEHIKKINDNGLVIESGSKKRLVPIKAFSGPKSLEKRDLVIFLVKSYDTYQAAKDALPIVEDNTFALTLQNGIGNVEILESILGKGRVIVGTTSHGATLLAPGMIRHAGKGPTYIGEINGTISNRIKEIAKIFNNAGIDTEISSQMEKLLWRKLIINIGINGLTALTGLKNGQLLKFPETIYLMEKLINEALEVASKKGIEFEEDMVKTVKDIAELTRENRSSMGQDIDRKKRTEIDAINGAVIREAEKFGVNVDVNRTITYLIKTIEKNY